MTAILAPMLHYYPEDEMVRCAHGTAIRDSGGELLFPPCGCRMDRPYGRACDRCGAKAQRPCVSVGPDSYTRGAPLRRAHAERYKEIP
jgi:hypothetical protein